MKPSVIIIPHNIIKMSAGPQGVWSSDLQGEPRIAAPESCAAALIEFN